MPPRAQPGEYRLFVGLYDSKSRMSPAVTAGGEPGATEVLVSSARRWALMHENRQAPEPGPEELMRHMTPVDLLLIEGFKREGHDKLEVWRAATGKPLIAREDRSILAVASDGPVPDVAVPVLDLDDVQAIADFILDRCGLPRRRG